MKAVVAAFNQEKALVGAFSVITNLRMELFEALVTSNQTWRHGPHCALVQVRRPHDLDPVPHGDPRDERAERRGGLHHGEQQNPTDTK